MPRRHSTPRTRAVFTIAVIVTALLQGAFADEHNHVYEAGEQVVVWANGVGPYHNRQETYDYFQLPFCKGASDLNHRHESLGEALLG
ncbi:hypothetical protein HK405_010071, partial [Cladochytrium tenue]